MTKAKEFESAFLEIETLLRKEPRARERANKNRAISYILKERYPHLLKEMDTKTLTSLVRAANTLDRAWRKVVEETPELRGSDYKEKPQRVKEMQSALGYKI